MKKINRLLFILVLTLISFVGLKSVNAETIYSPDASCGDFPKDGDSLITECSSSGQESALFDVQVMTWYKGELYGSSTTSPGESVGTTGVYESGYQYYLELKFTPKTGNEFTGNVNFNIIGLSEGAITNVTENGEYIVVFEFTVHHVIHFETNGGTPIADIVVTDWCHFDMPNNPVKDGYTFLAWYLDPEFEDSYYGWCVDESMTFYAKYVPTANMIKNINVTLDPPVVGTDVVVTSGVDEEWGYVWEEQEPKPTVTLPDGVHYSVDYTAWVQGICTPESQAQEQYPCYEKFEGTIMDNEYYYASISVEADENYAMTADDLTIKVNGQDPDEVFAVYDNNYTTFIAKIKSSGDPITDVSKAKVSGIKTQTYNGKVQRQDSLVVTLSGKTLVKDTDYTVSYSNLTNAGTIKMTIKGIGDYEGTLVKTFVRNKAKNTLTVKAYNKTVYYSKVKSKAQVVKPITIVKKQGTLTYTKMSGSSAKLLLNKTTGKVTVKKGTKKGKYKIKIKIAASGNSNYKSSYGIRTVYITVK